jgi:hypothetical protein
LLIADSDDKPSDANTCDDETEGKPEKHASGHTPKTGSYLHKRRRTLAVVGGSAPPDDDPEDDHEEDG